MPITALTKSSCPTLSNANAEISGINANATSRTSSWESGEPGSWETCPAGRQVLHNSLFPLLPKGLFSSSVSEYLTCMSDMILRVCVPGLVEASRECWMPWNGSYRWLQATVRVLRTEAMSFARTASASNSWALSSPPCFVWDRLSLYILGWTGTKNVAQVSLKLEILLPGLLRVRNMSSPATISSFFTVSNTYFVTWHFLWCHQQ